MWPPSGAIQSLQLVHGLNSLPRSKALDHESLSTPDLSEPDDEGGVTVCHTAGGRVRVPCNIKKASTQLCVSPPKPSESVRIHQYKCELHSQLCLGDVQVLPLDRLL